MRIARGISIANASKPISSAIVYDTDAVAFFTAASITDTTQKSAVNTLVLSLKSVNIWTKMKALYPVVGGVASAHAVNLKSPGTYNLSFATGWTHASTGMTPNGATFANTNFAFSSILNQNSISMSAYSRTNKIGSPIMGAVQVNCYTQIYPYEGSNTWGVEGVNSTAYMTATASDSFGFYQVIRQNSNTVKIVKNSTITAYTNTSSGNQSVNIYLGCRNYQNSANNFDTRQIAFASIGDGLTDTDATNFYNAVQNYQTTLGRQV